MNEELKVGDFVFSANNSAYPRIVIIPSARLKYPNRDITEVGVLPLMDDAENYRFGNIIFGFLSGYYKTIPTLELIESARKQLMSSLLCKNKSEGIYYIDNLTYIEISARLREYEQQI